MSLSSLLSPASVAIAGVSSKTARFQVGGRAVFEHLIRHRYSGKIDLITRRPVTLHGKTSVSTLSSLPEPPDCLVLSVPALQVVNLVREALEVGIRAFVTVSAGFKESGPEGSALQDQLTELLQQSNSVMLGPNTTGYINFVDRIALSSTSRISERFAPSGSVGVVVQSGALGSMLMDIAERDNIGLSYLISTGNEAVTDIADCVDFLIEDPNTQAIALYVEAFRNPARIIAAAKRAFSAGKPIVIYKAGRSETGQVAAAGHTGALLGTRGTYEAAVNQLGLVNVESIEDLLPVTHYMSLSSGGRSVGILTVSGGLGGCLADTLAAAGGTALPKPSSKTAETLQSYLPSFLSPQNPVDIGGSPFRDPKGFTDCLSAFANDPAFDTVTVANTPIVGAWAQDTVEAIQEVQAKSGKTISAVWPSEIFNREALASLRSKGIPAFSRVDTAVAALNGSAVNWTRKKNPTHILTNRETVQLNSKPGSAPLQSLDEAASKHALKNRGVQFPEEYFLPLTSVNEAPSIAKALGYPITLKGIAQGVAHKSDHGLVLVGVPDEASLLKALARMTEQADSHNLGLRGFLLVETIHSETEVFAGISYDCEFGPALTIGTGGIYTEVYRDVATRLLPVSGSEIVSMLDQCRVGKILRGTRGKPALDIPALVALISQLAHLGNQLEPGFAGFEINPIGVGQAGKGAWIFDATVFVSGETNA